MFNSALFTVKNIALISIFALLAVWIFNHFQKKVEG